MIEKGTDIRTLLGSDILGLDQNGHEVRLSDYPGKTIALYFYPKDSTPGCTAEACSITANYTQLLEKGLQPIGVSVDSATSHQRFITKNAIPFPLIADTDHNLVDKFGVWGEKKLGGHIYMGTLRSTFLISPDGKVERVFTPKDIKTKLHGEQLLAL